MRKVRTRIGSILLVTVMLLSLMPATALAADEWTEVSSADVLSTALKSGGNIKLTDNITVTTQGWTVTQDVVLDLNGHSITSTYAEINNYIMTVNGASLTVTDNSTDKNGKIAATDSSYGYGIQLKGTNSSFTLLAGTIETTQETVDIYTLANNCSIIISGGKLISSADSVLGIRGSGTKVNITGGNMESNGRTGVYISNYGNPDSIIFDMTGGKLTYAGGSSGAIQLYKGATLTIGGTAEINSSSYAVQVQENTILNVEGGTLTSTGTYVVSSGETSSVNITGGKISGQKTAIRSEETSTVNISGGEIKTTSTSASNPIIKAADTSQVAISGGQLISGNETSNIPSEKSNISVTGGTFQTSNGNKVDVSNYLPSGMMQDESGVVVKNEEKAKVSVDGVWYETIQEAIAALQNGSTMTIMSGEYDVTATRTSDSTYGSGFIIDKDNVTITAADPEDKPVIYGFTNKYSAGTGDGGINGQDTIYVSGSGVTLENLIIMPLGGYKGGDDNAYATKTVEVTSTATGFKMTGCKTTPNSYKKGYAALDNADMTQSGNIHVSINDATISGNSFGTGTTISAGWTGTTAAEGTYSVDVSQNYWGADATAATIANAIDGNVKVDDYYTNEAMTETATIGGIPVSTSEQLKAAITSAKEGDTIIVAPGDYDGNITFGGKSLTIKAQYPAYKDGTKEEDASNLSEFTGTFNTYGDASNSFYANQKIVIEGFAFSGNGLKVGNTNYNSVGTLEVRNCTMTCGGNLEKEQVQSYNQYNHFVKVSGNAGEPYASVVVEDNYVSGTLVTDPYTITPIQLWDVKSAVVRNNVIDVKDCTTAQGINVSLMKEDAAVEITGNEISGVGGGIYVTTWKLGGNTADATAQFTGAITVEDNELKCVESEDLDAIFLGYEEAASNDNPYGLLAGTQTVTGNTDNGEAVNAEIVRGPETTTTPIVTVTATFKDGDTVVGTISGTLTDGKLSVTTPAALEKTGYTFKGWSDGTTTYNANTSVSIEEDTTFTAVWSKNSTGGGGGGGGVTTYAVSLPTDVANGTIAVSPKNAAKGATVTLTVTPDEGYVLNTITVTDKDGKAVELTKKSDTQYTFQMPASKVSVQVSFTQEEAPVTTLPFTDVSTNDWFYEAVAYAYENGMMNGVAEDRFAPASNLTRGMITQVLYNLEGNPPAGSGSFTDVADGQWYADAVNWAAANDIVGGYGNGKFGPENNITREQMAQILYNYAIFKGYDVSAQGDLSAFSDGAKTSDWALTSMKWAVGTGLLQGYNGTLNPTGTATRAEVAQIFMNFCENIVK